MACASGAVSGFSLVAPGVNTGDVKEKPIDDAGALEAIANEVEAGGGPVALVRPGHRPVVLVSAEEWQRLDELESADSTAWWRRDAAGRRDATGEEVGDDEHAQGLDEDEVRRRFAHPFRPGGQHQAGRATASAVTPMPAPRVQPL